MRINIVLIDFENVQPDSIAALNHDHFRVFLFCGANQTRVSLDLAKALQRLGTRAEYVQIVGNGPNALDFHIAYYIGQLATAEPTAFFHVVSRDKGFDPLIQHLKARSILALRSESIAEIPIVRNGVKRPPAERAEAFIARLKEPKVTRPRTVKTLGSAIRAHFQLGTDEAESTKIIRAMEATGFISIAANKIVYSQSAT